jgi:hypothetical protein
VNPEYTKILYNPNFTVNPEYTKSGFTVSIRSLDNYQDNNIFR